MITVAVAPLTTTFLVAIRIGTVLLFSPIEAIRLLPIPIRLILVLIISWVLVGNLKLSAPNATDVSLILGGIAEFCNGLILSLSFYAAFAAFQIAGQLIDTQMGLNALAVLNPRDHSHELVSSRLLMMLAVLFFFGLDGHIKLIQGLAQSFRLIPPGKIVIFHGVSAIIKQFSFMFSMSVMIASPIVISLLIIDGIAAVLTRNMPQISIYFLTLPIKIMLGLFLLGVLLTYVKPIMEKTFDRCFYSWQEVMS